MKLYGIMYIIAFFILIILLVIEGYLRQRERYWRCIWEKFGKSDVNSVKELKIYIQKEKNNPIDIDKNEHFQISGIQSGLQRLK